MPFFMVIKRRSFMADQRWVNESPECPCLLRKMTDTKVSLQSRGFRRRRREETEILRVRSAYEGFDFFFFFWFFEVLKLGGGSLVIQLDQVPLVTVNDSLANGFAKKARLWGPPPHPRIPVSDCLTLAYKVMISPRRQPTCAYPPLALLPLFSWASTATGYLQNVSPKFI